MSAEIEMWIRKRMEIHNFMDFKDFNSLAAHLQDSGFDVDHFHAATPTPYGYDHIEHIRKGTEEGAWDMNGFSSVVADEVEYQEI